MNHLSEALALAIAHISSRATRNDDEADDDVTMLESLAAMLKESDPETLNALANSAARLAAKQTNPELKAELADLMEHLGL